MEPWWYCLLAIAAISWIVLVVGFGIYFWFRVMPSIRELRKTTEGELALSKLIYPPRFPRR